MVNKIVFCVGCKKDGVDVWKVRNTNCFFCGYNEKDEAIDYLISQIPIIEKEKNGK